MGPWLRPWLESLGHDSLLGYFAEAYSGIDLLLIAAVAYDLTTRRQVHRVNAIGVPLILTAELVSALVVLHWSTVARMLVRA